MYSKPQDYDVTALIPQRSPMIMVDRLLSCDSKTAVALLEVRESNIFVHNGCLQEAGIVEFMAQTAAAFTGFKNLTAAKPVTRGYIGAVKNLAIQELPPVNTTLHAEITVENEIVGYTIVNGIVKYEDHLVASCEMRILTGTA
ncbi:MAG: hypothetical protein JXB19_00220 [Bacteroidales bacterium]|nr:hypothetical protein [Bacteroidales bacterium]